MLYYCMTLLDYYYVAFTAVDGANFHYFIYCSWVVEYRKKCRALWHK